MHYLTALCEKKETSLRDFPEGLTTIFKCTQLPLEVVMGEFQQLQMGQYELDLTLKDLVKVAKKQQQDGEADPHLELFIEKMTAFNAAAAADVKELREKVKQRVTYLSWVSEMFH